MATATHARPVSYQGGWTLIAESDRQSSSALVHYTPNPTYSIGLRTEWDRVDDLLFTGVQGTWLAKRWFGENYQANLYVWGAGGVVDGVDGNSSDGRAGAIIGVMADWETRRWYLGYRARANDYGSLDRSAMQGARIGWAAYEGDTGDLHTWLMLDVDHRPDAENSTDITPLLRFFKGAALFEAGYSLRDNQPLINFQYRF